MLTVTDADLCAIELQIVVSQPTPISEYLSIQFSNYTGYNIACKGENSGWVSVEASGGYIPFTYAWNTGETTDSISNLYAGIYNVTVTDGLGCLINYSLNLLEPTTVMSGVIAATTDYNNYEIRCFGNQDGAIEEIISTVIQENPVQVEAYLGGKEKLFGFFVGQVMKLTEGKANPKSVNDILKEKLR